MEETVVKQIPCPKFFARLGRDTLFEGFVQYLAVRIADQQQVIANLVTVDSEQRLGKTLLTLARTLGKKDPRSIRIELKITHEELSEMVGTTRPRISVFMQRFRNLGLIETNEDRFLIIKEKKLSRLTSRRSPDPAASALNSVISSNTGRNSRARSPIFESRQSLMVRSELGALDLEHCRQSPIDDAADEEESQQ